MMEHIFVGGSRWQHHRGQYHHHRHHHPHLLLDVQRHIGTSSKGAKAPKILLYCDVVWLGGKMPSHSILLTTCHFRKSKSRCPNEVPAYLGTRSRNRRTKKCMMSHGLALALRDPCHSILLLRSKHECSIQVIRRPMHGVTPQGVSR